MTTATRVESIPPIQRAEVEGLAATEYGRLIEQLRSLTDDEWATPTDCPLWDVRAVAGHCVGMMSDFSSFRSLMRRLRLATRAAKTAGGPLIDSMTAQQVADHADLTPPELVARAQHDGRRAAGWRAGAPRVLRAMPVKQDVGGRSETWRIGYLLDVILTRDPWMHRVDIARATGRDLELTAAHDGRIVADVVAEWARRHGQPFRLTLTGVAGGEFFAGDTAGGVAGDPIAIDAVEFCRTLSGRAGGRGLLAQEVPF